MLKKGNYSSIVTMGIVSIFSTLGKSFYDWKYQSMGYFNSRSISFLFLALWETNYGEGEEFYRVSYNLIPDRRTI